MHGRCPLIPLVDGVTSTSEFCKADSAEESGNYKISFKGERL